MNKEIKLSVNNLRVSFRTDAGKVQAVRDISFNLYKGETLAIVGESGSGKSVTSKAIMGISAVNSIYEGGEILYDGHDLLRIPEEEMHKIRGDKIAMIFQDPLSSLNPIMRIGKQITEAMLLKNKANRKEGREAFNKMLATLLETIKVALSENNDANISIQEVEKYIKTFDDFHNNLSLSPLLKHLAYPKISVPFLVHCLKAAIFVIYQKLLSFRQVPNAGRIDSFRIVL